MLLCTKGELASSATVTYECLLSEHTRLERVVVRDISSSEIGRN